MLGDIFMACRRVHYTRRGIFMVYGRVHYGTYLKLMIWGSGQVWSLSSQDTLSSPPHCSFTSHRLLAYNRGGGVSVLKVTHGTEMG